MSKIFYECPSYYCSTHKYIFYSDGLCPECNKQLTKCNYKTDDMIKDLECPVCHNGNIMTPRYAEPKRYVPSGITSTDVCDNSKVIAPSNAIERLRKMIDEAKKV